MKPVQGIVLPGHELAEPGLGTLLDELARMPLFDTVDFEKVPMAERIAPPARSA